MKNKKGITQGKAIFLVIFCVVFGVLAGIPIGMKIEKRIYGDYFIKNTRTMMIAKDRFNKNMERVRNELDSLYMK